jgi:hypothetical protein
MRTGMIKSGSALGRNRIRGEDCVHLSSNFHIGTFVGAWARIAGRMSTEVQYESIG